MCDVLKISVILGTEEVPTTLLPSPHISYPGADLPHPENAVQAKTGENGHLQDGRNRIIGPKC